ncbi:MAG: cytidine/deoxycytidylate deaminase family protein [Methanosarcinales archaeon]|nr:cytidine/deoxycytidylate deaminase family protein [Methanosarcinales archaeon]
MVQRPTLDEYFMEIAQVVAKRSTCLRNQVGAVIVLDKRILSTGYNGAPRNLQHCLDIGCIRQQQNIASGTRHELCRAVHAEQNAIIQSALHGVSIENATLYCTHQPCILCAKMIINSKIKKVVFSNNYPDDVAIRFFNKAGVEIVSFPGHSNDPG